MKKTFTLLCAVLAMAAVHAQCPQFVAFDTTVCSGGGINRTINATVLESQLCGDSVTIVFNDSTTTLNGSNPVYFHAGPEFTNGEGWQGAYTADSAMQQIGPHLWTITFSPRSFFNYSPDSCLYAIACGFRDSNYANYVKCGNSDIYIVTATGAAVNTCGSATFMTATYTHSANITYLWNDANTSGIRTFTTGGHYTVTATGVGGCTVSGYVNITLDSNALSIGNDTIECTAASYTFVATPGFSTYQWLDAAPSVSNTQLATYPGMYWVQATDSFGCVYHDTATVQLSATTNLSIPPTLSSCPGFPVSADASTNINKFGDSLVITYNASLGLTQLIGDTNVYMYSAPQFYPFAGWPGNDPYTVGNFNQNDGIGRMKSLGNNMWTITIDPQSYYHFSPDTPMLGIWMVFRNYNGTLTGKDSNGVNNNIYLYTVPNPPSSTFDGISAYHKAPQPLAYSWSNGIHTPADTFSTGGTYYVTVSDGVCSRTDSVVVTFNSNSTINIGADTGICAASDTVIISAPAGYAQYAWSNGATTQTIAADTANTYTVTVTTSGGCQSTGQRAVILSSPAVSLGPDIFSCADTSVTLTATPGFVSYTWLYNAPSANTLIATKTGSYWVTVTDSFGCRAYDTVTVRYSDILGLSLPDTFSSCPGNQVGLDASTSIRQNGDSLVITYDATQGQSGLAGAAKVYMHSAPQLQPGAMWGNNPYTVGHWGLDDGLGEMHPLGNNLWSITIFPQAYYQYSPDSTVYGIWMVFRNANGSATGKDDNDSNIILNLTVIPPAGENHNYTPFPGVSGAHTAAGNITYAWSIPGDNTPLAVFNFAGPYTLTVSDGLCSKIDTVTVNEAGAPAVNLGPDTCLNAGHGVVLNADSGYSSYLWSTGASTQEITANLPGTYWVQVTNAAGCTGSDTVTVDSACGPVVVGGCVPVAYFRVLNISPYDQVTLKDSSTNGKTYLWHFGDGTTDTSSAHDEVHTYAHGGTDTISLTVCNDTCGCNTYSVIVAIDLGISGIAGINSVNLYPNPATDICTVRISAAENADISIDIADLLSQVVRSQKWHIVSGENKLVLDLSAISSGMYTMTMRSATGILTRKIDVIK